MDHKINRQLDSILRRVEKPARYIGGETNMVRKDSDEVALRFGFAFPDTYEIGMSYLGLQILYDILNSEDDIYCERIFAPAPDMEEIMIREHRSLFTLESHAPVTDLDAIGFTLQYEMSFTNVLNMLELAGIPLRSRDRMERGHSYPIVIAGGPCAFNPEPMADFIDAFLIGDGEELLPKVLRELIDLKSDYAVGNTCSDSTTRPDNIGFDSEYDWRSDPDFRIEFLRRIAKLDGIYVPMFYEPEYNDDGTLKEMKVAGDSAPSKVSRALVSDIDGIAFPTNNLVPLIDTVHDRSVVETFRGCTRGCRFCQAGMIYRPVRERPAKKVVALASEQLERTGHDELSLLSLSTSDHSNFEPMAVELMGRCKERNVALSLPSLRLDSFSFKVLEEIQGYRKSGLTFAPEAGTQRLRDVINKNITEEDIYSATRQAIELGWETIKLYFMIGLPTETDEDLDGIAQIAKKIVDINYEIRGRKGGRFRVTVSVSNFVPKPHTPFQWVAQDSSEEFIRKHDYLSRILKIKGVTYNYHESNTSMIEAVFARGDRRCGAVLEKAHELGCRFDAWTEHFDFEKWLKAFELCGIDPDFYATRQRSVDEVLPWDHIDSFVDRKYLESEYAKATQAQVTPDCREGCTGCGMNRHTECFKNAGESDFEAHRGHSETGEGRETAGNQTKCDESAGNDEKLGATGKEAKNKSGAAGNESKTAGGERKYAIEFSKTGTVCYTSHLDLMRMFKRAFKRAGIPLAYSQGFNPHPKMGFAQPLSLGYWGMSEYIEFEIMTGKEMSGSGKALSESGKSLSESGKTPTESGKELSEDEILERLSAVLPEGINLIRCLCIDGLKKTLAAHTVAAEYMIEIPFEGEAGNTPDDRAGEGSGTGSDGGALSELSGEEIREKYMSREEIPALKRQKKSKELKEIDIKPMIRDISFTVTQMAQDGDASLYINTLLDQGSASNLSPELVISSVMETFGIGTDRSEVSVMRKRIVFDEETEEMLKNGKY